MRTIVYKVQFVVVSNTVIIIIHLMYNKFMFVTKGTSIYQYKKCIQKCMYYLRILCTFAFNSQTIVI